MPAAVDSPGRVLARPGVSVSATARHPAYASPRARLSLRLRPPRRQRARTCRGTRERNCSFGPTLPDPSEVPKCLLSGVQRMEVMSRKPFALPPMIITSNNHRAEFFLLSVSPRALPRWSTFSLSLLTPENRSACAAERFLTFVMGNPRSKAFSLQKGASQE